MVCIKWMQRVVGMGLLWALVGSLAVGGCSGGSGGGGGGNNPPSSTQVRIDGRVDDGLPNSPIANAICSFVRLNGVPLATVTADANGGFSLSVSPNEQGFIQCNPPALPNLTLSTFVSTSGQAAGTTIANEQVNPVTTMVASILAVGDTSDSQALQARKAMLLTAFTSQPLLTEAAIELFVALRESQLNISFGSTTRDDEGDAEGGATGEAGDGAQGSPLASAVCEFALRLDGDVLVDAALGDFLADGILDRPDLQAIAARVNAKFATRRTQLANAFATFFPTGLGRPLRTTANGADTSTPGRYFLPTPSGVPGFVRCHPPEANNLMLSTFVRARQPGETVQEQDVTPGTTVISNAVTAAVQANPATDPEATKEALLDEIDFQIFLTVPRIVPQMPQGTLANPDLALLVFASTTTFDAMRTMRAALPPTVTFRDALQDFFSDGSFGPALMPIASTVQNAIIAPANQMVLGTSDVVQASTTGTLRGTVTNETGTPLAGARVLATQNGAEVGSAITAANGAFTIPEIPAGTTTVIASAMGFAPKTSLVTAVAVAIVETNIQLSSIPSFVGFRDVTRLSLIGDATPVSNALRLRGGIAWFRTKQLIQDGFETTFQFRITNLAGILDCENKNGGDGVAFVIQNESVLAAGIGGGGLGYSTIPNSVAIEFDTWCNTDINDPNGNHISVHTRGIAPNSDNQAFALGTTTAIPDMSDGNTHTVKITYVPGTLRIFFDNAATPVLQVAVNLATLLNLDVGRAFVGFTSGIAGATENHDILAWSFASGPDPEFVTLQSPLDEACTGLTVTFQWNIVNPQVGITYCSEVLTDKGTNPFDGRIEDRFPAGQATALQVALDPRRYNPASFEWGVRVTACNIPNTSCPCQGDTFDSEIHLLRTNANGQNCSTP